MLPSFSKLFAKIVFINLTAYLKQNLFLFDIKYGFRENHSTELAIIELMIISALDEKKNPIPIDMDLSQIFDTLGYNMLLTKLRYYGINETPIRWLESYLTDRL